MIARVCVPMAVAAVVLVPATVLVGTPAADADEFRVDNRVFVNSEKEPRVKSTTVFCKGLVYDFLQSPQEVTVFDPARGRFVLLDPARRVRTELSTEEVATLCGNLQSWASKQSDPFLRFTANPEFEEAFDERAGELVFSSEWVTYRVAPIRAESEAMSRQYREFSDWYTRLNARLNPGSKLPFPRLSVNRALEKRQELPREVRLAMQLKRGLPGHRQSARSEHTLSTHLTQADRDRVAQAQQFAAIFKPVSFEQYEKAVGR